MNSTVRIIKRAQNKIPTGDLTSKDEQTRAQSTREIVKTVKGWISELHQRRRDERLSARSELKLSIPTAQ